MSYFCSFNGNKNNIFEISTCAAFCQVVKHEKSQKNRVVIRKEFSLNNAYDAQQKLVKESYSGSQLLLTYELLTLAQGRIA